MENQKVFKIKTGWLLLLFFLYFVASFLAFVFTSSGWTGFLIYGIGGLVLFGTNCLLLFTLIISKKSNTFIISKKWITTLVIVQLITLFFTLGDYGDNAGSRSFFEVILGRSHWSCIGNNDCSRPPLLGDFAALFAFLGMVSYLITLLVVQIGISNGSETSK